MILLSIKDTNKEYIYARIKHVHNDELVPSLFLYAGLTKLTVEEDINSSTKNVKPVVAKLIELPLHEAPEPYVALADHELRAQLDYVEFERLRKLAEVNLESFMIYQPDMNQKIISMNDFSEPK